MPSAELNNIIKMINHIADNIAIGENDAVAAPKVAAHIRNFWARSMKDKIIDYAVCDGKQLNTIAKIAVLQLK
jgi:formate dehydrogenase subunit delta